MLYKKDITTTYSSAASTTTFLTSSFSATKWWISKYTPENWRLELENHPFEKENHLNQSAILGLQLLVFGGVSKVYVNSGQISIIPKPELRGFGGSSPYFSPPFRVTTRRGWRREKICPDVNLLSSSKNIPSQNLHLILLRQGQWSLAWVGLTLSQ